MKLIIGLGNPEERYINTRHNIGFRMLDTYVAGKGVSFQTKDRFKAMIAEFTEGGEKVLLAKPTTYYNETGEAARLITDFYKIKPQDILIVHDELALPFGTIRTRIGGSDAGNNGIKSINSHIGEESARVRIGIYNDLRDRMDDAEFVLGNFSKEEAAVLEQSQQKLCHILDQFVAETFEPTTH